MKKLLILAVAVLCTVAASAQDAGRWAVGPRMSIYTNTSTVVGLGAVGRYSFTDHWRIEPSLMGLLHDHCSIELSCNAQYVFHMGGGWSLYPEADNWQGSVALIVGLFAKEQVVSSLNTLYSIGDAEEAAEEEEEEPLTWGGAKDALAQGLADACATIPDAFSGLAATFRDPIGYEDSFAEFEESPEDAQEATLARTLAQKFDNDKHRAFAYLLFVLLYVPCLAAMATVVREIGWAYSSILFGYLTLLGWCVATLYYQVTVGHSLPWVIAPCALLAGVAAFFAAYGRKHKIPVVQ